MIASLLGGFVGALLLYAFYRALEHKWPQNYYSARDAVDPFISRGMGRYLAFRCVPVYVVAVLVAVTVTRSKGSALLGLSMYLVCHLLTTNIKASLIALGGAIRGRSHSINLAIFNSVMVLLLAIVTVVAGVTYEWWTPLVPQPKDVGNALWTGVVAAVIAAYVQQLTSRDHNLAELVKRSRASIGRELITYTVRECERVKCDTTFLEAMLVTEALQRPRWVRRFEYLKGRLIGRGTYGILQVQADEPITDRESITRTADAFAGFYPERGKYGVRDSFVRAGAEQHNADPKYVSLVSEIYMIIDRPAVEGSTQRADDKRPVIEVNSVRRCRDEWDIRGTAALPEPSIEYLYSSEGRRIAVISRPRTSHRYGVRGH